ncbi:RNA polymerase sigma-54 factor [Zhongshania aliphaticivorans]|uniref:RNA polymerase sigma-54 factor n=1 Tax=Zhongshania aliphaticivorans TaxID=1470434 RepID=A0A5S9N0L5_9GAMM|nr:RNA polymerase factor sigma-54 [Zhongshania aliphaticivorans]CAA0083365.1 RNA polymerase sigma-54 factor [Zhongshania aliphaticivorans]CAA0083417.1 RNA polymerase sigma-54 factor [Zhongshania aliphaticivorans]
MKQSLQLKVGQSLTMTPQLQQAIRLLQLSTLDLQQEIQSALDSNPLLEISDEDGEIEVNTEPTSAEPKKPEKASESETEAPQPEADTEWAERSDIPEDLPVDSQWDDVFQTSGTGSGSSSSAEDSDYNNDYRHTSDDSLQDHLRWQLNLSRLSELDQMIAAAIIDAIDEKGRLTVGPEELVDGFDNEAIEIEEVNAVLHLIQQFDPPGVGGRDLQECLLIQLRQLPRNTPYAEEACLVVSQYMAQLGNRDYSQIMRRCRLKEEQLRDILKLIQSLDPTPGSAVGHDDTEYVVPDVFVSKKEGRWLVELNPDIAPKIQINAQYASMARQSSNSSDNDYIRDNLQEARWFIKSLISRNETLMKVATKIVEYQRGFLEYGEEAMKPLVLHDIAEAVGMHESTISRVTTQKFMHTPRGIFELKFFFSSHVSTDTGGECSSTAIRALIKKLVATENPRKPLSDSKITDLLAEQGIQVARRTIAKYRESLVIPPSNERKRLV